LTDTGRLQARALGENWADTRINYLLSSPLDRALDTASALSEHNEGHPEVITHPELVERKYGEKVARLMKSDYYAAHEELTGKSRYSHGGSFSRSHCPAEGGESLNMVAMRAHLTTLRVLAYGVKLSEAPEFFVSKKTTTTPAVLPDGIPHVVIVSHNVFLMELYEGLHSWGGDHVETKCHWNNTSWWVKVVSEWRWYWNSSQGRDTSCGTMRVKTSWIFLIWTFAGSVLDTW
jgi:broad specificity phosphatase PhoE